MIKENIHFKNKFGLGLNSTVSLNLSKKISQETINLYGSNKTLDDVHPINNKLEGYGLGFLYMFNKYSSLSFSFGKAVIGLDYTQYLYKNIFITGILTGYGLKEIIIQKKLKSSNWYTVSLGSYYRYDKYFIDYDISSAHPQMKFGPSSSFSSNSIGTRLSFIIYKDDNNGLNYSIALIN